MNIMPPRELIKPLLCCLRDRVVLMPLKNYKRTLTMKFMIGPTRFLALILKVIIKWMLVVTGVMQEVDKLKVVACLTSEHPTYQISCLVYFYSFIISNLFSLAVLL